MSKICKRVHRNDEKNLPSDFKKCPGLLHFSLLADIFWTETYKSNFKSCEASFFNHQCVEKTSWRNNKGDTILYFLEHHKLQKSILICYYILLALCDHLIFFLMKMYKVQQNVCLKHPKGIISGYFGYSTLKL